jgi:hypothetical protein
MPNTYPVMPECRRPSVIDSAPQAAGRILDPGDAQNRQIWRFARLINEQCHRSQTRRYGSAVRSAAVTLRDRVGGLTVR